MILRAAYYRVQARLLAAAAAGDALAIQHWMNARYQLICAMAQANIEGWKDAGN